MRKVIASMNMTLDGYCNHTAGVVDDELHEHYNELIRQAGVLVYGRITYQLMEDAFPALVKQPSGDVAIDKFAVLIDSVPKLVFSHTLKSVNWRNTTLATQGLKEEVVKLKQLPGKDIFVGSPGLIAQLTQLNLIDEYWLCIHPIVLGSGLVLFKDITWQVNLKLLKTKTLGSGVVAVYYERVK